MMLSTSINPTPFGYIYETTNLINGRKYIGKKHSSIFLKEYKGSGKALVPAVKKYGKENFKVEVICWCYSEEELNKAERYYIKIKNADLDRKYYNISIGGAGSAARGVNNGMYGRNHSEETRKKISKNTNVKGEKNPMFGKGFLLEGQKNGSAKKTKVTFPDGKELEFNTLKEASKYLLDNHGISKSMVGVISTKPDGWQPRKRKFLHLKGLKVKTIKNNC